MLPALPSNLARPLSETVASTMSTLTTFTAADGENLAVQDWPLMESTPRGTVLLVHGLGEHVGRYDALARRLNAWGFAVRGYDQYGHGESGGPRGGLTSDLRLLDDLADMVDATQSKPKPACSSNSQALAISLPARSDRTPDRSS